MLNRSAHGRHRWWIFATLSLGFTLNILTTPTTVTADSFGFDSSVGRRSFNSQTSQYPNSTALQTCLLSHNLQVISDSLSDPHTYYLASQSDNLIFHYNPYAIVFAQTTQEVVHAVNCASSHGNVAVAARSGGHSFGGYGSGGRDGSLVIDLGKMDKIDSKPDQGIAQVQPGARLGDVVKHLWHQGGAKLATAHGTCPTVGVGGHALCGGFGPTSPKFGMTMDNIIQVEMVLANGTVITVSDTQHPKLMWALRGSGSFFGIVTNFVFKTYDASGPTTFFEYKWMEALDSPATATKLIMAIQEFAHSPEMVNEIGFHIQIEEARHKRSGNATAAVLDMRMRGSYLGPRKDLSRLINVLQKKLAKWSAPAADGMVQHEVSYLELMADWDDFGEQGDKLNTEKERKRHNNFITKTSLTLDHTKGFNYDSLLQVIDFAWKAKSFTSSRNSENQPWWMWNVYMEFFGGQDPEFRKPARIKGSSFPYRDATWLIQLAVGTSAGMYLNRDAHSFLKAFDGAYTQAITSSGLQRASYSCYTDPDLKPEEWKSLYYGDSLFGLEEIKIEVDPNNLFRNPQTLGSKDEIQDRRAGIQPSKNRYTYYKRNGRGQ